MKHEEMVRMFEKAAGKKGYHFDRDECGNYIDIYLQEAWEIFGLIDFGGIDE